MQKKTQKKSYLNVVASDAGKIKEKNKFIKYVN
jgi:hypothetical protein